ncbi:hypothetical protein PV325_006990 [Microctonus aethiopoides]|uniref:Uncharacterized protein n=1 Tax=Microctonus aethiopoides TaxID=144406 RepID=A0AA39FVY2_9HYME|nr:hypothetical protein PV325_006990 [Microctonus aethiopoides]KAK0176586.1 hypothetical protein PV328_000705 [Microctonus aethiopoides]
MAENNRTRPLRFQNYSQRSKRRFLSKRRRHDVIADSFGKHCSSGGGEATAREFHGDQEGSKSLRQTSTNLRELTMIIAYWQVIAFTLEGFIDLQGLNMIA